MPYAALEIKGPALPRAGDVTPSPAKVVDNDRSNDIERDINALEKSKRLWKFPGVTQLRNKCEEGIMAGCRLSGLIRSIWQRDTHHMRRPCS